MSVFFASLTHSPARDVGPSGKPCTAEISNLSINATGNRVINTRSDKSIRVWRSLHLGLSAPTVIENAHPSEVCSVLWVTNSDTSFASVAGDCWVKIWKCTGQLEREVKVVKAHGTASLELVAFSPDGEVMCVVDSDGTVMLFDPSDNFTKVAELKVSSHVNDVKWPNKGHGYILAAQDNGTVEILEPDLKEKTLRSVHVLRGHKSAVTCLSVDPRGRYIACGTAEGSVSLWRTSDMLNYRVMAKVDQAIAGVEINRDGTYVAVAFEKDTNIKVFESETLNEIYEVPNSVAGSSGFLALKWIPHRGGFIYVSDKGKVMQLARKETGGK